MDSTQQSSYQSQLKINKMWQHLYQQQHNHHHQIMHNPSSLPSTTNRFPPHLHTNIPLQMIHKPSPSSSSSLPSPTNRFLPHPHTNIPLQINHNPSSSSSSQSPSPSNSSPFQPNNNLPLQMIHNPNSVSIQNNLPLQNFTTTFPTPHSSSNTNTVVKASGFEDFRYKLSGFSIKGPDVFDSSQKIVNRKETLFTDNVIGCNIGSGLGPTSVSFEIGSNGGVRVDNSGETIVHSSEISSLKRKRGRPRGSSKKASLAKTGVGLMPHVISVDVGEDIASKFVALFKDGTRTICTLSVSGSVPYASLQDPTGAAVNYEGPLDIISITGSMLDSKNTDGQAQTIGLNVTLCTPDIIVAGSILGKLIAATPVRIIVGSSIVKGKKKTKTPRVPKFQATSSAAPPLPASKISPSQDDSSDCISNSIHRTVGYFGSSK